MFLAFLQPEVEHLPMEVIDGNPWSYLIAVAFGQYQLIAVEFCGHSFGTAKSYLDALK